MNRGRISAELADQIKQMWEAGVPASHIGARVGRTRDSVLGLIRKLRKSGVAIERVTVRPPKKQTAQIINFPIQNLKKDRGAPKSIGEGVRMADLKLFSCRYIEGETRGYRTIFCGQRTVQGSSYCEEHAQICYRPAPKSKPTSRPK